MFEKELGEIGQRLQKYLKSQNLSINAVAKELALHPSQVYNMLKGKNYGIKYFLDFLVQYPELNLAWLLSGKGNMLTKKQHTKETLRALDLKTRIPEVAKRLAAYLKEKNLSINAFAKALKLHPSQAYNMVRGKKRYGTGYILVVLLRYKDIDPVWLLTGKQKENKKQEKRILKEHILGLKRDMQAFQEKLQAFEKELEPVKQEEIFA